MTAVGGPIEEISIRGRIFACAADGDANFKPGAYEVTVELNGDGTGRKLIARAAWGLDGLNVSIDHDRADLEFLNERLADPEFDDITVTFASGSTWQGKGTIAGRVEFNHQKSTAAINIEGTGEATQQ